MYVENEKLSKKWIRFEYCAIVVNLVMIGWLITGYGKIEFNFERFNAIAAIFIGTTMVLESIAKLRKSLSLTAKPIRKKLLKINNRENSISGFGLFIAAALQKREDREAVLGCIEEQFNLDIERHGFKRAEKLFWIDIFKSVFPAFWKLTTDFILGLIINKIIPK